MRIPDRFKEATMESLDKKQYKMVFEYQKRLTYYVGQGRGLILSGPPGVGKTWALAALSAEARKVGVDFLFQTAPEFFEVYASFDRERQWDAYRNQSMERTYSTVPWLVLNDLGKEYRGGKLAEQVPYKLGRLLRTRSERCKVTHITTNLALVLGVDPGVETIKSVYGESISSLLSETNNAFVIQGSDRRKCR